MPLRCLSDNGEIHSFTVSPDAWELLKQNYRGASLRMACCGMPAIPKTSSLGTFFFSHARRGECISAPETKEHLLAKTIIAKAAISAGWKVTTEYKGHTPDGTTWIADVMAERGTARVAFEVQWSPQTVEETVLRQNIYNCSNVRGLWLFKQGNFISSKDVPAFRLVPRNPLDGFTVKLKKEGSFFDYRDDWCWSQEVDLAEFIKGSLTKRLSWALTAGIRLPVTFEGVPIQCWKCKKTTTTLLNITFHLDRIYPGRESISVQIYDFEEDLPTFQALLPKELYTHHHVGVIKRRYSKTINGQYISNGCVHCDALQGQFFEYRNACKAEVLVEKEVLLTNDILNVLAKSNEIHDQWYFSQ